MLIVLYIFCVRLNEKNCLFEDQRSNDIVTKGSGNLAWLVISLKNIRSDKFILMHERFPGSAEKVKQKHGEDKSSAIKYVNQSNRVLVPT